MSKNVTWGYYKEQPERQRGWAGIMKEKSLVSRIVTSVVIFLIAVVVVAAVAVGLGAFLYSR